MLDLLSDLGIVIVVFCLIIALIQQRAEERSIAILAPRSPWWMRVTTGVLYDVAIWITLLSLLAASILRSSFFAILAAFSFISYIGLGVFNETKNQSH